MAITPDELLRSDVPELLSYAAEDIGRALADRANHSEELMRVRREIVGREAPTNSYQAGFRAALDHLLAGYLASTQHNAHLKGRAQAMLANRPNWVKVLRALRSGASNGGQIASTTGLQTSAVSRTLNEMSDEGLIERSGSAGSDQRIKLIELTRLGQELCESLAQVTDSRVELVRELAPVLLRMLTLASERAVVRPERVAQELATQKLSASVAAAMSKILLKEAETWGLLSTHENTISFNITIRRESSVLRALQGGDSSFLCKVREWAEGTMVVVRASTDSRFRWDEAARRSGFDNFRTICDDDFLIGVANLPKYSLVYESKPLVMFDTNSPEAQRLICEASRKGCFAETDEDASEGFERLAA